jgi:Domain of unknown function (DUF4167)
MRPNNRQRSRGGRNGGGGGNQHHHKPQHNHNPNRPPNRNQIFDSSGPDVRVRGNAHQVFDKYQALAREAAAVGDRIQAEAYFQYADHYYRVIQTQGGFINRGQGWNDGGEDSQNPQQQQDGQSQPPQSNGGGGPGEGYAPNDRQNDRQGSDRQGNDRQGDRQGSDRPTSERPDNQSARSEHQSNRPEQQRNSRSEQQHVEPEAEPGLNGVAFLQNGRSAPSNQDPAIDEQPEVPEFRPSGRRS